MTQVSGLRPISKEFRKKYDAYTVPVDMVIRVRCDSYDELHSLIHYDAEEFEGQDVLILASISTIGTIIPIHIINGKLPNYKNSL